jgi:hypothetical protein
MYSYMSESSLCALMAGSPTHGCRMYRSSTNSCTEPLSDVIEQSASKAPRSERRDSTKGYSEAQASTQHSQMVAQKVNQEFIC